MEVGREVWEWLGVTLSPATMRRFGNYCLYVQLNANCRENDVFLIQPLVPPVQEHLVQLLFMLDAARGASAARTTAVIPFFSFSRSNKKDPPPLSIAGPLTPQLLSTPHPKPLLTPTLPPPPFHPPPPPPPPPP